MKKGSIGLERSIEKKKFGGERSRGCIVKQTWKESSEGKGGRCGWETPT